MGAAQHRSTVRRFASKEIEPERSVGLLPGHPALSEGRTIFPSTVVASKDSPRFLVSGHNNPKLGKAVLKGPRTGWPIYQLSLEERATCPRSCVVWSECYGNAMPYARRHTPDADFLRFLIAEVTTVCRAHPEGLLIRLHTLGDFYSVEYVYVWASLLNQFPQLHIFGYTARRVDDGDHETSQIARAIETLTEGAWDRFAIRTSGISPARSRSIVVHADPQAPNVIVCPAQTSDTEACASCGLCWAGAARDKTIAFLKHGMKSRAPAKVANDVAPLATAPGQSEPAPALKVVESRPVPAPTFASGRVNKAEEARQRVLRALAAMSADSPNGISAKRLQEATGLGYDHVSKACSELHRMGKARWAYVPGTAVKALSPLGAKPSSDPPALSPNQTSILKAMQRFAVEQDDGSGAGLFHVMKKTLAVTAGVPLGSITSVIETMVQKRVVEITSKGAPHVPTGYRLQGGYRPVLPQPPQSVVKAVHEALAALPIPVSVPVALPTIPIRTKVNRPATAPSADDLPAQVRSDAIPKGLIARKPGQCAYPTNSPAVGRGDETTFCCAPVIGKLQYCEVHARAMWPGRKAK